MRIRSKGLAAGVLSASLVLGGASAALATVAYPPEGGTWEYGTSSNVVYSNYYHATRSHGSSVKNCHGSLTRSPTVLKGAWSHAQRNDACSGEIDYAYYRLV